MEFAMTKPALLSTGPMMPLITDQIEAAFEVHWMHKAGDVKALIAEVGPRIEAVCTGSHTGVKTDADLIAKLPKLKIISNFGVGYDTIDVPAAVKAGVIISNTPDVLNEEVADTALGLLLSTVRELSKAEGYMRAGRWPTEGDYRLTPASLRDRKIGMMGLGRIGKAITRRLEAFGLPISYYARNKQTGVSYPHYSDLTALARDVDTLIAILPGGPATQNIVNAEVLKALGPRGIFINMARGSIVDEAALIAALKNRTILSAGLDVFWNEPKVNPEFLTLDNVTLLPHVGSASVFTRDKMGQLVVDNLILYRDRKPPVTPVPDTPFKGW
jgi:lactate dehydrogenase-like 2-hydroxyacid dehydrogenase